MGSAKRAKERLMVDKRGTKTLPAWDDPVWQNRIMQSLDAVKKVLPNTALVLTVEVQRLTNELTEKEAAIKVLTAENEYLREKANQDSLTLAGHDRTIELLTWKVAEAGK